MAPMIAESSDRQDAQRRLSLSARKTRGRPCEGLTTAPEEKVKGIKVPMLALIGENDPLRAGVDELKNRLPALKVVVIDRADHVTAFGREEFVSGLKEFLDAHRGEKR